MNKGFISQKKGDRLTIFDTEKSIMYTFNVTAGIIFRKLKAGKNAKEIALGIHKSFKISLDKAEADTQKFIEDLKKKNIISRSTE